MIRRFLVLLFSLLSACSLTTSLDGLSGGAEQPQPSTPDGAASPDAASDEPPPGVDAATPPDAGEVLSANLLESGSFDTPNNDVCKGTGYQSTVDTEAPGRNSSALCCEVCATGASTDIYTIDRFTPIAPKAGEHYRLVAWVTKSKSSVVPPSIFADLRTARADPFKVFDEKASAPVPLTTQYTQLVVDLAVTQDAPSLEWFVGAPESDTCFYVDDVAIYRVTP